MRERINPIWVKDLQEFKRLNQTFTILWPNTLNLIFHEYNNHFTQQMIVYILINYYCSHSFNKTATFSESRLKILQKLQRRKSIPTLELQSMPISDWHYEFCLINHTVLVPSTRVSRAPEFPLCSLRLVNGADECCSLWTAACAGSASEVFCGTESALDTETGSWRPPAHIWSVRHELQSSSLRDSGSVSRNQASSPGYQLSPVWSRAVALGTLDPEETWASQCCRWYVLCGSSPLLAFSAEETLRTCI